MLTASNHCWIPILAHTRTGVTTGLLIRAVFFSLSALKKEYSLLSGLAVIGALLCIQGIVQPFKSRFNNVQESFVLLNLLLLYLFTLHDHYNNTSTSIAQYLILVVLLYFILFIVCTCVTTMCRSKVDHFKHFIVKQIFTKKKNNRKSFELNTTNKIPDVTFNYKEFQEPLVAVTD